MSAYKQQQKKIEPRIDSHLMNLDTWKCLNEMNNAVSLFPDLADWVMRKSGCNKTVGGFFSLSSSKWTERKKSVRF